MRSMDLLQIYVYVRLTEEATDGESCGPNTQTLGSISKAAFEFEDYLQIVNVLHKRSQYH